MNILIVMPRTVFREDTFYPFPLGILYISAILKRHRYNVECLNLNQQNGKIEEIINEIIKKKDIDIVATGGLAGQFGKIKSIIDAAKKSKPNVITIVGGGLLSSEPSTVMEMIKADIGVIGEGEETIIEVAWKIKEGRAYGNVKGIIYRAWDGRLYLNQSREPIDDIDSLPYPDYEGFGYERYLQNLFSNSERGLSIVDHPRLLFMISSRSCPFSCTFCYHPIGKKYRKRSLDTFFQELYFWKAKYDVNILGVMDELFANNRERVIEFCERIKKFNIKWTAQLRVDNVDKNLLALMRDSGCIEISYGLESGSDTILKSMKKHIKTSHIVNALEMTHESRMGIQGNFLFGDVSENLHTVEETFELWLKLHKHNIYMIPVEVYPGTPIYNYAIAKGIIKDKCSYISNECPSLNLTEMTDIQYIKVMLMMYLLRRLFQPVPARIIDLKEVGIGTNGQHIYHISVICPHCREVVVYNNLSPIGTGKLNCKECYRRFDIVPLNWNHEFPVNFEIAERYSFSPEYMDEIRQVIYSENGNWIIRKDETIMGYNEKYMVVWLFGNFFLIPQSFSLDDIRYHRLQVFLVDKKKKAIRPLLSL